MRRLLVMLTVSAGILAADTITGTAGRKCLAAMPSFEFRPGVIVDPNRHIAYLMRPTNGVTAIDLVGGKIAWTSLAGDKPLITTGTRVVAQAEIAERRDLLRLVVLRADDGAQILHADATLPTPVRAGIDDTPAGSFTTTAHERDGRVAVSWAFSSRVLTGMDSDAPATSQTAGVVEIDVTTGSLASRPRDAGDDQDQLSPAVRRAMAADKIPPAPWRAGTLLATTVRVRDGKDRIVLKRWRAQSGEALEDVILFPTEERWTVRFPSADGEHLLVSRPPEAAESTYTWRIFSLATGRIVADVAGHGPAAWFFLAGGVLVHDVRPSGRLVGGRFVIEQPLRIRGIRLTDGTEVWSHPIRDPTLHQAYPPITEHPIAVDPPGSTR